MEITLILPGIVISILLLYRFWPERGKVREVFNLSGILPDPRPLGCKTTFYRAQVIKINGTLIVYRKARPNEGNPYFIVHGQKISGPYYSTLRGEDVIKVRTIPKGKQKDITEFLRSLFSEEILFW